MAYTDDLTTSRDNLAARLAEITASPKPTYNVNGQMFSWTEYQRFLLDGIRALDELVAANTAPFEILSRGL